MSMIGMLLRVPEQALKAFIGNSALLFEYLDQEDNQDSDSAMSLEKSWDAVNFLVTGYRLDEMDNAEGILSTFFFSGQSIDEDQDMGYGPAQYLEPAQVKAVSSELSKIDNGDFRLRYDANKLNSNGIYPEGWDDSREIINSVVEAFDQLKSFYSKAASENQAIITYIS